MLQLDLPRLVSTFAQLQRNGVTYAYGGKANSRTDKKGKVINPDIDGTMHTPVDTIHGIDCSGFTRYILFNCSTPATLLPDGSQAQRGYFEQLHAGRKADQVTHYADINAASPVPRLHINFIKPHTNGCGDVGHVWLTYKWNAAAEAQTLESCGGRGVTSRRWDDFTLVSEFFSAYRLI